MTTTLLCVTANEANKNPDGSKYLLLYFNHVCDNELYNNLAIILQLLFHYIIFYFDGIPQLTRRVIGLVSMCLIQGE